MNFVKLGNKYLNLDRVSSIIDTRDYDSISHPDEPVLYVCFTEGSGEDWGYVTLRGAAREVLLAHLETVCLDLLPEASLQGPPGKTIPWSPDR